MFYNQYPQLLFKYNFNQPLQNKNQDLKYDLEKIQKIMDQINIPTKNNQIKSLRRPSFSASSQCNESTIIIKKKYTSDKNQIQSQQKKLHVANFISNKQRVCNGQKLTYQLMKDESNQINQEVLLKYTRDPFMRKKLEKSVEKLDPKKSNQNRHNLMQESKQDLTFKKKNITTFRQQINRQQQKTFSLMNSCNQLIQELKTKGILDPQQILNFDQSKKTIFGKSHPRRSRGNIL